MILVSQCSVPSSRGEKLDGFICFRSCSSSLTLRGLIVRLRNREPFSEVVTLSRLSVLETTGLEDLLSVPNRSCFDTFLCQSGVTVGR